MICNPGTAIAVLAVLQLLMTSAVEAQSTASHSVEGDAALSVQLQVTEWQADKQPAQHLPCMISLTDAEHKIVPVEGYPFWHDHFVCDGQASLTLPAGRYDYEVYRGPEYATATGTFSLVSPSEDGPLRLDIQLKRIANLRAEGWYCGDMHIHRPAVQMESLLAAADLDWGGGIGWWNTPAENVTVPAAKVATYANNRVANLFGGEDERAGGALLYFNLDHALNLQVDSREYPSSLYFAEQAVQQHEDVWIDAEKPFWWDYPIWLAAGFVDSVGIANNHMCRGSMLDNEAWGKPRDRERFPAGNGNGEWSQFLYYATLNAGFRLPPSAGSASGVLPNPVGYNRVYVHAEEDGDRWTNETWFKALAAGRCFVTNGPLLRVRMNGQLPGSDFALRAGEHFSADFVVDLTSVDEIPLLEVVHNGQVVHAEPCQSSLDQQLRFTVDLPGPGWVLVRAVANNAKTFRFASTGPWYLPADGNQPVSGEAAQFFATWTEQRIEQIESAVEQQEQREQILPGFVDALEFWRARASDARSR